MGGTEVIYRRDLDTPAVIQSWPVPGANLIRDIHPFTDSSGDRKLLISGGHSDVTNNFGIKLIDVSPFAEEFSVNPYVSPNDFGFASAVTMDARIAASTPGFAIPGTALNTVGPVRFYDEEGTLVGEIPVPESMSGVPEVGFGGALASGVLTTSTGSGFPVLAVGSPLAGKVYLYDISPTAAFGTLLEELEAPGIVSQFGHSLDLVNLTPNNSHTNFLVVGAEFEAFFYSLQLEAAGDLTIVGSALSGASGSGVLYVTAVKNGIATCWDQIAVSDPAANQGNGRVQIYDRAPPRRFIRGDVNLDFNVQVSDAIVALAHLFDGGAALCQDAADANDDGVLDISDPIRVLQHLFVGGGDLPDPNAFPGAEDLTADNLDCDQSLPDPICP